MIAYKGTNQFKCNDIKYEIGRFYIFNEQIQLYQAGFHVCTKISDVHKYYNFNNKNTIVLEVEIPNDADIIKSKKDSILVANKLKVLRALTKKDIEKISNEDVKFDENGNLTYIKFSSGYWERIKYNKNGKDIYYENSSGCWAKREFNENGESEIYWESPDGGWTRSKTDERGNEVYWENSKGFWVKQKFDNNGNVVYCEDSNGFWAKREFDERGALIYFEDSGGHWWKRKFDNDGNEIYYEDNTGYQRYQNMWLIEDQNKIRGSV